MASQRRSGKQQIKGELDMIQNSPIKLYGALETNYVNLQSPASLVANYDAALGLISAVVLTKANLLALNATPIAVVAAPGAGFVIEFLAVVLIHDFGVAAYTGGGAITIEYSTGGVLSNAISAAQSFGSSADAIVQAVGLDTANGIVLKENVGLVIKAAADFTDPGTAVGTGRVRVAFRLHPTGL